MYNWLTVGCFDFFSQSGASEWTTPEREVFANDLVNPALIAVSKTSNSMKSDSGPEEWKPEVGE